MGENAIPDAWRADSGHIVDILSHELRSPITTIHLGTRVLHDGSSMPTPVRQEVVAAVEEETERLYRLVEDLLAVARHDDGDNPLPVRPLLLQHWILDVVDREVRAQRRLRVRVAVPADLPPVQADEAALGHVLRNLLANVDRHAGDGMPAEVVVRRAGGERVSIDVLDRGPGFAPEETSRLFEPFYRGPAAEATGSGAGLGLAAGRRLMRAMGGDLGAQAREGGGSRFMAGLSVAVPEDDRDEPADVRSSSDPDAGTGKSRHHG
jgi:K+-sensing histidine kinase KdpD